MFVFVVPQSQVCRECEATIESLRKFASFREAFAVQRKIVIFYNVFAKLKLSIEDCINSFGLFVKSFVEQAFVARKSDYVECQTCHRNLVSLFDSLTKALKRLMEARFESARENTIAAGMRVSLSEWIQERLSHLRALETHWKQVRVQPEAVKPVDVSSRDKRANDAATVNVRVCMCVCVFVCCSVFVDCVFVCVCEVETAGQLFAAETAAAANTATDSGGCGW